MKTETELKVLVKEFSLKIVGQIKHTYKKEVLRNIRADVTFASSLRNEIGIYYFVQNGEIQYVGRALPSVKLRARLVNQINAFGDPKWNTVIEDDKTEFGVVIFDDHSQWHFISALEHFLIEKLRPEFNKRA